MGLLDELGGILKQYQGASASAPPANVENDFKDLAPRMPEEDLSRGLGDAFRSTETPPFPQMLSQMFGQSNGMQRAGILNQLLGAAGPSLLGGLSSLLQGRSSITPEEADRISPGEVEQMAANAEQQNPSVIDMASDFYAKHPTLVQGLGAGALALMMSRMSRRG